MARLLAFASLLVPVFCEVPACATIGEGYSDQVNGQQHSFADDAMACQEACKRTDICAFFTWYPDTKGCWLQSSSALKNVTFEGVVSGPVRCPGEVTTQVVVDGETGATHVGTVVKTLNDSTGASFPWWAWVLIGLGIAVLGLCILSFLCCGNRKKSKRSTQKVKKDIEAPAVPESAPLMPSQRMQAAPAPAPAAPIYTSASAMAAPVGSGVYTSGNVAYTSTPQVMYTSQTAAPVTTAPVTQYVTAAPVATTAQDLFTQLDANGDGQLSPEELAAMQGYVRTAMPAVPAGYTYVQQ